jgi:hypothetical protein
MLIHIRLSTIPDEDQPDGTEGFEDEGEREGEGGEGGGEQYGRTNGSGYWPARHVAARTFAVESGRQRHSCGSGNLR